MTLAKLDQRITIQQQADTLNTTGEQVGAWSDVTTVWTAKRYRPGREFFQAGRTIAEERTYFIIRYRSGIEPGMRILDGEQVYDITSVTHDDERKHLTQLEAREVR